MALNREQKRHLKKAGDLDDQGEYAPKRQRSQQARRPEAKERVGARQYVQEVRGELRKVVWPSREETINYSIVVFFTLVVLTLVIFALDWIFARSVLDLFAF